ncbi:MAG: glycosyltransferase [Gemmatimonadaceae bacterium]
MKLVPDFQLLTPTNAVFVLIAFEGPDAYSQAGGLGVRMSGLGQTLAQLGYSTHQFFIGDPSLPGEELTMDKRLVLHRWSQWISASCPAGVYDGEEAKHDDLTRSLPAYALERVILPAIAAGRRPVILLEEWQTAEAACALSDALRDRGVRDRAVLLWNANNPYGFDRIDWQRLARSVSITVVSRYMRSIVRSCGVDARVIPNGISADLLSPVARADVRFVRAALGQAPRAGLLFKMARWERDKGWGQAIDAVWRLRHMGRRIVFVGRAGGTSGRGGALAADAHARGLRAVHLEDETEFRAQLGPLTRAGADVISLGFGVTPDLARTLFAAADGVLANSVSEPFGLVGLEAMAAGGIAYTGGTGEDYAIAGHNAIVLQTLDPNEIVAYWDDLSSSPEHTARLRREARKTAREYEWSRVIQRFLTSAATAASSMEPPGNQVGELDDRAPEDDQATQSRLD